MRIKLVSVIGGSECTDAEAAVAEEIGRRLAQAGVALVCGGRGGVMEAACRGAAQAGGLTIGLLPGESAVEANPHVRVALPTGMGEVRNVMVARAGEAVIAVGGGLGTLSEIAHALRLKKPVVAVGSWQATSPGGGRLPLEQAATAQEAVALALRARP